MATATKICKVCGGEYEYCHTNRTAAGVFRWQDVACCPEHGAIYFAQIMESRAGNKPVEAAISEDTDVAKTSVTNFDDLDECDDEDDEDESDDEFDEDFDDEAEDTVI